MSVRGDRLARGVASALFASALTLVAAMAADPPDPRRSGYAFMSAATRAMQDDDASNPGLLSVLDGEALWARKAGDARRACVDCHGDATISVRGTAARYPAWDAARGRPINVEERINICRVENQQAPAFAYEGGDLLALTAFVGRQSRGLPIDITVTPQSKPFLDAGEASYRRRQGQLNLACSHCHDDNAGRSLAGNRIPEAHPTGYPLYRLEWQALGSLQRRLRNCLTGIRAEAPPLGAKALVELEYYLMWRARGMRMETPAVRP